MAEVIRNCHKNNNVSYTLDLRCKFCMRFVYAFYVHSNIIRFYNSGTVHWDTVRVRIFYIISYKQARIEIRMHMR